MRACSACSALNRSLACRCRSCNAPFEYQRSFTAAWSGVAKSWATPAHVRPTHERFWLAPVAYAGWLWFLSVDGQLSRYSPFSGSFVSIVHLGEQYGRKASMVRAELAAGENRSQPAVVVLGESSLAAVGLIDYHQITIDLNPGETAFADVTKAPCGVAAAGTNAWFLTDLGGAISLVQASLMTGDVVERVPLPGEPLAGPFRCGGHTHVYSETRLYVVSDGEVASHAFPAGFKATVQSQNSALRPAFGRLPFMVTGSQFYIPGRLPSGPAFLRQHAGGTGGVATIPISGETTYAQDPTGRPVLAQDGSIAVLEDTANRVIQKDSQLSARYPAFAIDGIAVGMVEPSPTSLRLRIYQDAAKNDFVVSRDDFQDSVGLYAIGSSLTACVALRDTTVRLYSWIC